MPVAGALSEQLALRQVNGDVQCGNTCITSLKHQDNVTVAITPTDGRLTIQWEDPVGNVIVNTLQLHIVLSPCKRPAVCTQTGSYRIQTWDGSQWHTVTTSAQSMTTNITVTDDLGLDNGYKARVINENAPVVTIDKFALSGDFRRPTKDTETFWDVYENNRVFIHRIGIGMGALFGITLAIILLRKIRLSRSQDTGNTQLSNTLQRHAQLKDEIESVRRELNSVEKARQDLQKQYYRREVDENTFKDMMQKYEQDRKKLQHQLEELREEMRSMVVE